MTNLCKYIQLSILFTLASCNSLFYTPPLFDSTEAIAIIKDIKNIKKDEQILLYLDSIQAIKRAGDKYEFESFIQVVKDTYLSKTKNKQNEDKQILFLNKTISSSQFTRFNYYTKYLIHSKLSSLYHAKKKHHLSLQEMIVALSNLEKAPDKHQLEIGNVYNEISLIAGARLMETQQATKAAQKAIAIFTKLKKFDKLQILYFNIAIMEMQHDNFFKAKKYLLSGIQINEEHTPDDLHEKWEMFNTALMVCLSQLGEKKEAMLIYNKAKSNLKKQIISQDIFDFFISENLESLLRLNEIQEFNFQTNRLKKRLKKGCAHRYQWSLLYYALSIYAKQKGDISQQKKLLTKTIDKIKCSKSNAYFDEVLLKCYNQLIEIDSILGDYQAQNIWLKGKVNLASHEEEKRKAYIEQLNYWTEKDLKFAQKEVDFNRMKLKLQKSQKQFILIVVLLLLYVSWYLWKTKNEIKRSQQKLKKSYAIQSVQKNKLKQSHNQLEIVNKEILSKNREIEDELKSKLLLLSNNYKILSKLKKVIKEDDFIKHESKKGLLKVVNLNFNEQLIKEIDFNFVRMYEGFHLELLSAHPNLTQGNLKLCTYMKIGLTTKEIASLNFASPESVKVAKSRLRKKMNMSTSLELQAYLKSIKAE